MTSVADTTHFVLVLKRTERHGGFDGQMQTMLSKGERQPNGVEVICWR